MMEPNEEFWLGLGYVGASIVILLSWAIVVWGFNTEVNVGLVGGTLGIGIYRIINGVRRQRNV